MTELEICALYTMGRNLYFLHIWLIQICCLASVSHTTDEYNQVDEGPCMDVNKSYALPRHNPVKVRDLHRRTRRGGAGGGVGG